ncbi:K02A2.6-like, partial [Cordylochernes scorpioides]
MTTWLDANPDHANAGLWNRVLHEVGLFQNGQRGEGEKGAGYESQKTNIDPLWLSYFTAIKLCNLKWAQFKVFQRGIYAIGLNVRGKENIKAMVNSMSGVPDFTLLRGKLSRNMNIYTPPWMITPSRMYDIVAVFGACDNAMARDTLKLPVISWRYFLGLRLSADGPFRFLLALWGIEKTAKELSADASDASQAERAFQQETAPQVLRVRRARASHPRLPAEAEKKLGPACLKAGGGFAASLPAINVYILNKGRSLDEKCLKFILDSGSEANIVNIDNLNLCTEGLDKPTYLKGISGKSLRSLGCEVLEIGAVVNGKPIREVRTTFEYCHMGELGFDGILGLPGFRALKLHLSYDDSIRSDYERKEDPTKSAFLSSLQTIEMSPQPPRIPLNEIHMGHDIFRAFSHCFCNDIKDMGDGSTITAPKLRMLTSKPVYRRQYPIPNKLVSKVKALVDELEEVGIIEGSTSLWNSPLFPVAKTDGSVRITMDLRMINEATEFFPFPIPRVEDNLRAFAGAKVFSTLDLTSGFFQIHIPESDRDYFTFSLPWGRYRFTRLPQGAKNSAQVFQWAMNLVLGDLLFKCVRLYIDDVIVYSDSHEQHVADLAAVLERLSKFGLKAKYGKSYLFRDSVEYLGHVIDQNGIKPMWDNVAALRNLKRPHNIKAVRSLLGTVNYYRRFIPNAGEVLAPLSNLLRKGHRFAWGVIEQSAFETVKGILTSEPLLIHPTIGVPFILNTDASGIAVGACLQQEVKGTVRPIAYYSKRLTGPEIRYSTIEKEAYAVVLSLQHFKHLLAGSKVEVHTDHKPITYNKGSDYKNARLSRWAEIIQDFNVTFIYVPGKENTIADFLSRFPCEDDPNLPQDRRVVATVVRDRRPPLLNSNQIWEGLLQEKGWAPVMDKLTKLKPNSTERYNNREYRLLDKYLVTKNERGTWVKVVPTGFRETVISYHHDIATRGHFGVRKVMRRLKGDYYWPGMRTQVRKYIRRCESCQLSNHGIAKAASAPHFRPEKPFEHLALDFIGPLEITPRGYSSILTIVDLFTKFPILIPTKDQCANTVIRALLERNITTFGVPKTILSDRGSAFMSCVFKGVCKAMGVGAVNTTAWRPQSNGAVERLNRTVIESLRRCTAGNNWDTTLPMVALAIRTTVHSSTGFTPAKLVFGHELRLPQPFQEEELSPVCEDSITEMAAFYERELVEEVERAREVVRQTYLKEQQEARAEFEARELRTFETGDLALVKRMHETKGRHKFEPRYRGPYEVLQRTGDTVYLLKELETGHLDKIHIDRMKAYHAPVKTYPTGGGNKQEQIDSITDDEDHWVHPTYPLYSHRTVEPRETATLGNPPEVSTLGGKCAQLIGTISRTIGRYLYGRTFSGRFDACSRITTGCVYARRTFSPLTTRYRASARNSRAGWARQRSHSRRPHIKQDSRGGISFFEVLPSLTPGRQPLMTFGRWKARRRIYYKSNKKNDAAIRRSVRSGTNLSSKISSYSRGTLIEKTEKALVIWIEDLTQKRIPLDGHLIKMKALKFYKELKESEPSTSSRESNPQFSASTGWLTGFIKRHSFHNLKIKGEVASADEEAARKNPEKLAKIIKDGGYCAHQIFNAEETGLFWKKMPTRTYIAKSEKNASGFKAAKDRVTLLLCSNASGDRMLKPLLVNRSLKPRALKGKDLNTLPVHWMANKKAWVTTAIFTEWFNKCFVPEVENYMKEMGLEFKILLILDNAPGHPNLEHPNIKVFGSRAWRLILPKPRKLDAREKSTIMVGYSGSGYHIWDPETDKVMISTDVTFDETLTKFDKEIISDQTEPKIIITEFQDEEETPQTSEQSDKEESVTTRSGRIIKPPRYQKDYELYSVYCLFTNGEDPVSYNQAIMQKEWKEAIDKEIRSHEELKT